MNIECNMWALCYKITEKSARIFLQLTKWKQKHDEFSCLQVCLQPLHAMLSRVIFKLAVNDTTVKKITDKNCYIFDDYFF